MTPKCLTCFLTFFRLSFFLSFFCSPSCLSSDIFFANDNKHSCHLFLQTYVKWQQWQPWQKRPLQVQLRDLRNKFPKTKLQLSWALAAWTYWQPSSSSIVLFSLPKYYLHILRPESCPSSPQALSAAGLGAGLTEAVVVNPFEVVKVSLQANRDSFKEVDRNKTLLWLF